METGERVVADYELVHLARALEVGVLELLGLEPKKGGRSLRERPPFWG